MNNRNKNDTNESNHTVYFHHRQALAYKQLTNIPTKGTTTKKKLERKSDMALNVSFELYNFIYTKIKFRSSYHCGIVNRGSTFALISFQILIFFQWFFFCNRKKQTSVAVATKKKKTERPFTELPFIQYRLRCCELFELFRFVYLHICYKIPYGRVTIAKKQKKKAQQNCERDK